MIIVITFCNTNYFKSNFSRNYYKTTVNAFIKAPILPELRQITMFWYNQTLLCNHCNAQNETELQKKRQLL